MNIALQQAEKAIAAAQRESQKRGELATFAVMDTGGNLVAFSGMDGANLMTIDVALGKAYTASISNSGYH